MRRVLADELDLRASGTRFVPKAEEGEPALAYRRGVNRRGSPSDIVAAGYAWNPGTELAAPVPVGVE